MMRIAYADPPYIGQAKKHYDCAEIDHDALMVWLCKEFPDGWALSCSTPSLRELLSMSVCPDDLRIGAWVKPFAIFKPNVNPAYAWEPVLFRGGRKRTRKEKTVRDWVSCNITLKRGLSGAKPNDFCVWLFNLMGMQAGDELIDIFHGTGAVTIAWDAFTKGDAHAY